MRASRLSIRLEPHLRERLDLEAKRREVSLNEAVVLAVEGWVGQEPTVSDDVIAALDRINRREWEREEAKVDWLAEELLSPVAVTDGIPWE